MALVASRFRVVGELLTPLAAAVNAMPIIVLAPMLQQHVLDHERHTRAG